LIGFGGQGIGSLEEGDKDVVLERDGARAAGFGSGIHGLMIVV
jgi:hypothetical protein